MKLPVRRYGIAPSVDLDGKLMYALVEVDETGQVKMLCAYNADREVLVRAITHLNGIFDERIEWMDRMPSGTTPASILHLVPPSNRAS